MKAHLLFPSHPLRPSQVEPTFSDQLDAFAAAGFTTSVISDSVLNKGRPLRNIPSGATVVYRGWMLNAEDYQRLVDALTAAGATALTSTGQYLAAHHLPNWYPLITELTPETRVYPPAANFEAELRGLGWDAFFIKDYVKSLKTSRGSIVHDPSEIGEVIDEMRKYRGELEGGLCVRRVERFVPDSERRFFVLGGKAFAASGEVIPEIVGQVASRIRLPFFSIDVARREDGAPRVVEIGDGQVSDLVGWDARDFAAIWR